MNRAEFNDPIAIPVIKGTNYEGEFAERDRVKARIEATKAAGYADNPYSAIYDWREEEAKALEQKEKQQQTQLKIMRTNALGEAFRVLGEGMSASGGAPVTPRNPNPFILNAVNEYAKSDMDYMNKLQNVSAKKLAFGQMDLQHKMNKEAAAAEREANIADNAQKELSQTIRELTILEARYNYEGKAAEAEAVRKDKAAATQALLEIDVARKKAQFDRGIDLIPGQGLTTGIDILTPPAKGDNKTIQFVTPDTKKTIYLNEGLINYISQQLSAGKGQYDRTVPTVLRDIMANKNPQPEALAKAFTDSWDWIRDNLLLPVPDLANQLGLTPTQAPTKTNVAPASNTTTQTSTPAPKQVKQEDGSVDLDEDSKFALLGRIDEVLNNTSIAPIKKIGAIQEFIYSTYQTAGMPISKFDAEQMAKGYVQEWRQEQRAANSK